MYNRLYNYLNENEILNDKQFGFRAGHSTEHAILELIDQVSNAFDNNNFVLGVFMDFSKAFDTVDHNTLIVYVNDHHRASNILKPIMFADDTELCCSGKHIKTLFQTSDIGLEKIAILFPANKLFLNESKTKFTLFHKS